MSKNNVFDFSNANYPGLNYYLLKIKDKRIRPLVANFFERSIISSVPKKEINKLIDAINEDVEKGIFGVENNKYNGNVSNAFNYMNDAVNCATAHDNLPEIVKSKALLFNCDSYDRKIEYKPYVQLRKELLHDFETEDEFYEPIREKEEYKKIILKLM